MNYYYLSILALTLLLFGCLGEPAIVQNNTSNNSFNNSSANQSANLSTQTHQNKVEIIHFHGTHQCYSCITMGQYAEDTVNAYFSEEVKNGRVSFAHINFDLPENQEVASKYGVTGSSLWIGVSTADTFQKEQNVEVWYKINNKEEYMNYLKGVIEGKLNGGYN